VVATDVFAGSAKLELVEGVTLLHPEDAVFHAMLSGWARQQTARGLNAEATIAPRLSQVRHFAEFSGEYPWQWGPGRVDEWSAELVASGKAVSTVRHYQMALEMFCSYLVDVRYGWPERCLELFDTHPVQVCHEWNTIAHVAEVEADPGRRPLTRAELQAFFDHIDEKVEAAQKRGRKGALTAYRDATLFKVLYGWGLRRREGSGLDLSDLHRNPKAPEFGGLGVLSVRYGKASKGGAPKRRDVASVMPWAVQALDAYLRQVRPRFAGADGPALFLTERGGRLRPGEITDRFAGYRDALGLDPLLTPHCLRRSYVTHLSEDGADPKFIQSQVGHEYASTTAIYEAVSSDFMNTMMRKAIDRALDEE